MFTADEQKTIYNVFQSLKCEGIEWPCQLPDGGGSSNTGSTNTGSSNTGSSNQGGLIPDSSNPGGSNQGSSEPGSSNPGSSKPGTGKPEIPDQCANLKETIGAAGKIILLSHQMFNSYRLLRRLDSCRSFFQRNQQGLRL